ncbi:sigma-E factor negative regulatory protein [Neptunicella sp. SCSIO 80796]|uniref:sigma-E factor negative regulatory protein n=1 Tax=Neptunicella plasticusilytica TaxID=3117012 RepID=UPI003A4D3CBD
MTQQKIESLSALVDGELQDESILGELSQNSELMQKWQGYHLVRDTMRKELPAQLNFDIAAGVAQALANEPTVLAPKKPAWRDWPVVANVLPLVRNAGQFAVAASVAAAVIFGVQSYNQPVEVEPSLSAPPSYLGLGGVQGGLSPVSLEQSRALPRQDVQDQRRQVIAFLTDHQQQMRRKTTESTQTPLELTDESNVQENSSVEEPEVK